MISLKPKPSWTISEDQTEENCVNLNDEYKDVFKAATKVDRDTERDLNQELQDKQLHGGIGKNDDVV